MNKMFRFALERVRKMSSMAPFAKPVDYTEFPTYLKIVNNPMDFGMVSDNIEAGLYRSTDSFLADLNWIVHNALIFNGSASRVTSLARSAVKIIKQEMNEIETCPDCYINAHTFPNKWFTETCQLPHTLVWARLKGFPFWPAKAVRFQNNNLDVRFFGRHDKSWVPLKDCYLLSEEMPVPLKNKNKTLESCVNEVKAHIARLKSRFGKFSYAPHRLQFDPTDSQHVSLLFPSYEGPCLSMVHSSGSYEQTINGQNMNENNNKELLSYETNDEYKNDVESEEPIKSIVQDSVLLSTISVSIISNSEAEKSVNVSVPLETNDQEIISPKNNNHDNADKDASLDMVAEADDTLDELENDEDLELTDEMELSKFPVDINDLEQSLLAFDREQEEEKSTHSASGDSLSEENSNLLNLNEEIDELEENMDDDIVSNQETDQADNLVDEIDASKKADKDSDINLNPEPDQSTHDESGASNLSDEAESDMKMELSQSDDNLKEISKSVKISKVDESSSESNTKSENVNPYQSSLENRLSLNGSSISISSVSASIISSNSSITISNALNNQTLKRKLHDDDESSDEDENKGKRMKSDDSDRNTESPKSSNHSKNEESSTSLSNKKLLEGLGSYVNITILPQSKDGNQSNETNDRRSSSSAEKESDDNSDGEDSPPLNSNKSNQNSLNMLNLGTSITISSSSSTNILNNLPSSVSISNAKSDTTVSVIKKTATENPSLTNGVSQEKESITDKKSSKSSIDIKLTNNTNSINTSSEISDDIKPTLNDDGTIATPLQSSASDKQTPEPPKKRLPSVSAVPVSTPPADIRIKSSPSLMSPSVVSSSPSVTPSPVRNVSHVNTLMPSMSLPNVRNPQLVSIRPNASLQMNRGPIPHNVMANKPGGGPRMIQTG